MEQDLLLRRRNFAVTQDLTGILHSSLVQAMYLPKRPIFCAHFGTTFHTQRSGRRIYPLDAELAPLQSQPSQVGLLPHTCNLRFRIDQIAVHRRTALRQRRLRAGR